MRKLDPHIVTALEGVLEPIENAVRETLAPAFATAKMDPESGAVIVPGWTGQPESAGYQADVVRTGTALLQCGVYAEDGHRLAARGVDFIIRSLWDDDHGGWIDRPGAPDADKTTRTQADVLSALVEFLMISGDFEVTGKIVNTLEVVQVFAADNASGGYGSKFSRDWRVLEAVSDCECAIAEAFGLAYVALGTEIYRRRTLEALKRIGSTKLPEFGALAPALTAAEAIAAPRSLIETLQGLASAARAESANPTDEEALNWTRTALEMWSLSREYEWLERLVADFESGELKSRLEALISTGESSITWALRGMLRTEALLVKALYGSN